MASCRHHPRMAQSGARAPTCQSLKSPSRAAPASLPSHRRRKDIDGVPRQKQRRFAEDIIHTVGPGLRPVSRGARSSAAQARYQWPRSQPPGPLVSLIPTPQSAENSMSRHLHPAGPFFGDFRTPRGARSPSSERNGSYPHPRTRTGRFRPVPDRSSRLFRRRNPARSLDHWVGGSRSRPPHGRDRFHAPIPGPRLCVSLRAHRSDATVCVTRRSRAR